jgi:hypothetical protein
MSEWTCPACGGGFPESALLQDSACPWCEFMLGEAAEMREAGSFHESEAFPSEE